LFVMGMAAFVFLWVWGFNRFSRKMSGWDTISARFPMTEVHMLGETYKRRSVDVGRNEYDGGFHVRLAHEGLCMYPLFARHIPCLIPWSSIRTVSMGKWSILLDVDYDKPFRISLPTAALNQIRSHVPPQGFEDGISLFEAVGKSLKAIERPCSLWGRKK
jgi:hypothetical protein